MSAVGVASGYLVGVDPGRRDEFGPAIVADSDDPAVMVDEPVMISTQ
jgi:hypothetical protein